MRQIYLYSLILLLPNLILAQAHDNNWINVFPQDDSSPLLPPYPTTFLNFETSFPTITYQDGNVLGKGAEILVSSKTGQPLFVANGRSFSHLNGQFLTNGEPQVPIPTICGENDAVHWTNSVLPLTKPRQIGGYYILQRHYVFDCSRVPTLLITKIENAKEPGSAAVTERDKLFFEGNSIDFFTATKHANGEDWWLVLSDLYPQTGKRFFHSFLINKDTFVDANIQDIPGYDPVESISSVATWEGVFSPDGKMFMSLDLLHGIRTHAFDRCTGAIGPLVTIPYPQSPPRPAGGAAFSPNSRFLYIATTEYLYQYDTWATDMNASKVLVAEYDGFVSSDYSVRTELTLMNLAPDGKIYLFCFSSKYGHYIAKPNLKGKQCMVVQRGLKLPTRVWTTPQYPNYRLGPIDQSPCDTLGIDNKPQADFWWFADSTLTVEFADNSTYEPANWHWDFGDGSISQDTSPVHTFPASGVYEVCLTVSNQYAADTVCKLVTVGFSSDGEPIPSASASAVSVFPNPADGFFQLVYELENPGATFELFDANGSRVRQRSLEQREGNVIFNIENLPPGIYFWKVTSTNGLEADTGKIAVWR